MTAAVHSVWRWPVVLGCLTATGLAVALFVDGVGDAAAWVGLGMPAATCAWFALRRSATRGVSHPREADDQ